LANRLFSRDSLPGAKTPELPPFRRKSLFKTPAQIGAERGFPL
jgi:hypothetical protein